MGSLKKNYRSGLFTASSVLSCSLYLMNFLTSGDVLAEQQYASKERATVARAHVSRARALLVEALAEFEESKKYARPDMLIDSEDWRLRVISLTEQLNRVIDPRPRVTREGAVFRTPPRFIRREREQLPEVIDAAKSRSDAGERDRLTKKQQERARFFNESAETSKSIQGKDKDLAKLSNGVQLPDEPALDAQSSRPKDEINSKEPSSNPDKSLFSNDLMPELNGAAKKQEAAEGEKLIAPSEIIKEEKERAFKDENSIIEEGSLKGAPAKSILPPAEDNSELQIEEVNKANKALSSKFDKIGSESVPVIITDDETKEVAPEDVAKQESEDEALARRLEESISEKLSNRDDSRN